MKTVMAIVISFMAGSAIAQDFDNIFYVSWNTSKPLSSTNWVDGSSSKGIKVGYRKLISDRFSAGVDFTWNVFDQYSPTTTFESPTGAVTTDYFTYLYSYGLSATGQYYLPVNTKRVMPYVGLGLGVSRNKYALFYNVYTESDDSWGFQASPEVGLLFPFGGKIGAIVGAHYDFSTATSDYFQVGRYNRLGVNVGLVFMGY